MEKLLEIGQKLGLEGADLREFILEQQARERDIQREKEERKRDKEREEKEREREEKEREREEKEREREEKEKDRKLQYELRKLEIENNMNTSVISNSTSNPSKVLPRLPSFIDYKDDMDSYLNRFERFAKSHNWPTIEWPTSLCALLTGRALDVYSRLSDEEANDYDKVKEALLKRYDLTEHGFRNKFRDSKPELHESPEQYITRLKNYLNRWIELSGTEKSFDNLSDLFIKEQYLNTCSSDLATFLRERAPDTLTELATLTDKYLVAHKKGFTKADNQSNRLYKSQNNYDKSKFNKPTANFHVSQNKDNKSSNYSKCVFCLKPHSSESCNAASKMDIKTRKMKVRESNRCFSCLKYSNHIAKDCRLGKKCPRCSGRHHELLCETPKNNSSETNQYSACIRNNSSKLLLMTASVYAKGNKCSKPVRLLIDGGSQRSYMRKELAKDIGARKDCAETFTLNSFGENSSRVKLDLFEVELKSKHDDNTVQVSLLASDKLCAPLEIVPHGSWISELKERGLVLADANNLDNSVRNNTIDIIIGVDHIWDVLSHNTYTTSSGLVATESKFGWILQGKAPLETDQHVNQSNITLFTTSIPSLWDLDAIGITDTDQVDEHPTFKNFTQTIEKEPDGRYRVPLIWKNENSVSIDSNFVSARKQSEQLEKRLVKDENLHVQYSRVFEEYLANDMIEEVVEPSDNKSTHCFYLPHHAVVKQSSESTKVRPVFNGSAKDIHGISLNELLDPGPSLLPLLLDILLRFRLYKVAYTGDITKAFLQLSVNPSDRDYLRFLWKGKTFRFKRVCFGISCAPFLLNATIRYHLLNHTKTSLSKKMLDSFYVDDLIMGAPTVGQAFQQITQSVDIMNEALFPLAKWKTCSPELHKQLIDNGVDVSAENTPETKTLGIPWNKESDTIGIHFQASTIKDINTKRKLLSVANSIFDPLGLTSPITSVTLKSLIRKIWIKGYDWDEIIDEEHCFLAKNILTSLKELDSFSVPRFYFYSDCCPSTISLHLFTDASEEACAACIYIVYSSDHEIHSTLVIAKSRLSPTKQISLPRLELVACCLGAKLLINVISALQCSLDLRANVFCWTDSMITLYWIRSSSLKYKPFVSNRIQTIQNLTPPSNWRHCPGSENPADQATRPISFGQWKQDLWLKGPSWLRQDCSSWPVQVKMSNFDDQQERKVTVQNLVFTNKSDSVVDITKFNDLNSLLRVTVYCLRAIVKFKKLINSTDAEQSVFHESNGITRAELDETLSILIKAEQNKYYLDEIDNLSSDTSMPCSKLKDLNPKLIHGLLYSVGRITHDTLVILPSQSHLTKLLVISYHRKVFHAGISSTLSEMRQKYWLVKPRRTVKSALRTCFICKRHQGNSYKQQESILSSVRINQAVPFETTGVDHAGPFITSNGEKYYLLIFTCTVVRAVYLECCPDLQASNFLLAFRRFQARCGTVKTILSDNSKTFNNASIELREYVTWRFIPEYSPTWGGMWERLIKSVKTSLKKCLGRQSVSSEILRTLFTEIECAINHRPITYVSDCVNDPQPLRPIDFTRGATSLPKPCNQSDIVKRYKEKEHHITSLWKRWKSEYLVQLRTWKNSKKGGGTRQPEIGDIVLVDPKTVSLKNRALWPLGKVLSVFPGRDGFIRYVTVLSKGRTLRRNTSQIYPLEIS